MFEACASVLVFLFLLYADLGRPELSRSTYFTWFSCSQPRNSYAQTFPGARILRGFRAPSRATATPRPFPEHVFYVVFVLPAAQLLRPDLSQSTYFTWFSCPHPQLHPDLRRSTYFTWFSCLQPHHGYAQTCPRARIVYGFGVPCRTIATPRPAPEHVFYVVFVPPAAP